MNATTAARILNVQCPCTSPTTWVDGLGFVKVGGSVDVLGENQHVQCGCGQPLMNVRLDGGKVIAVCVTDLV